MNYEPNSPVSMADLLSSIERMRKDMMASLEQARLTQEKLEQQVQDLTRELRRKEATIQHLLKLLYGRKTEKSSALLEEAIQPTLFDLDPLEYPEDPQSQTVKVKGYRKKRKGQREDNLKDAVHQKVVIEATEEEKTCPRCGCRMVKIGEQEVGQRVKIIEPQVIVEDIYTETYSCPDCAKNGHTTIVKTEPPHQCIPNSWASAEAVTHVFYERFIKGVPYNRQIKEWMGFHIDVSRRTLSNWIMYAADNWFRPIVDRMHSILITGRYIHADETPVDVFCRDSQDKRILKQCYTWVYCSIQEDPRQIRIFDFQFGRNGKYAQEFLDGFTGTLITDCYAGYNKVKDTEHAACWAHARRKFVECLPDKQKVDPDLIPVESINRLLAIFAQEKALNGLAGEEKRLAREKHILPLVDGFFSWVREQLDPKRFSSSKLESALKYCLRHEESLRKFLQDEHVPMTNSLAERTIRSFAIGRMNWVFSGSPRGAQAGALAYSIAESAKANGLNPYKYVLHILKNLPRDLCDMTEEVIDSFLPWNPEITALCQ